MMLWACGAAAQPQYELLLKGGRVIDAKNQISAVRDVAIKDGRIAAVGKVAKADARDQIDATGLIVAPGFIDVHTHADDLAQHPRAENFVRMGVTTIVAGNCGGSALDVGDALNEIRQAGASINFATLIGHNTVRIAAMMSGIATPERDRSKNG